MVGVVGGLVIREVAFDTVERYRAVEATACVTGLTRDSEVCGAERLPCDGTVVPGHRCPGDGSVTVLALDPEGGSEPIVLPSNPVTVVAAGRRAGKLSVPVALCARNSEMAPFEW